MRRIVPALTLLLTLAACAPQQNAPAQRTLSGHDGTAAVSTGTASTLATVTPTSAVPTTAASSRPAPTSPPAPASPHTTLPPGSALPSDAACAARVVRSPWEPRPDNATANARNLYAEGVRAATSYTDPAQAYLYRVTGNFTGTTDEILQWAACKWGIDVDVVRAQAVVESYWHQSQLGDCGVTTQPQTHGCSSVGLLQVKGADIPATHPNTWPYAWESSAWNVDYALSVRRACYDGKITWLHDNNPSYAAGDLWGCVGQWFSGDWYDAGAQHYIATVKQTLAARVWASFTP